MYVFRFFSAMPVTGPISKKSKYVCFTPKTYVFGITCDRALKNDNEGDRSIRADGRTDRTGLRDPCGRTDRSNRLARFHKRYDVIAERTFVAHWKITASKEETRELQLVLLLLLLAGF